MLYSQISHNLFLIRTLLVTMHHGNFYFYLHQKVGYVITSVCWITQKVVKDFDEISRRGRAWLNFGDDPDHRPDPGVRNLKSGFTGSSIKYLVDSDQCCIANFHCKNHSAFYYAGIGQRSVLSENFYFFLFCGAV